MSPCSPHDWSERLHRLACGFSRGELEALGNLFDLTAPRLLRYTESVTRNREDAEDAVQSTIVRLARNPKSLVAARCPWAYLLKMARNEALRIVEKRRRRQFLLQFWVANPNAAEESPAPNVDENSNSEVQRALKRLPAEQAEVVALKIWEGFTFQQIASLTGESLNTIASRYRYALSKLEGSLRRTAEEVGYVGR